MKKFSLTILLLTMLAICAVSFADTVQIGTGTATTSYLPIYGVYGYSYTQQIYTQAQINKAGNITKLRFFYVSGTITNSRDWVIYMGHTTKTTFSSTTDWEPLANLTQVFAGDVSSYVPLANNWMEIPLTTPFNYNNTDNLVIAVDENTSGYASMSWGAFTSGTNTGIYYNSDSINPDPASPPTASSRTNSIDRIQLVFPNSSAPLAPTLLSPANGGWAFTDDVLSWTPTTGAGDATGYDVYFGTSANPPLVSYNQTATYYTPTLSAPNTYYWKIVARNELGDSPASAIWSFKTPTTTQLVESFENTTFPPAGWANPGTWSRSTTYKKHGTASAYKYGSTSSQYILSTPKVTITGTSTLDLWTLCSTTTGTLQILYSPDRTTWTQIGSNITHAATYTWYNTVVNLSSLAGNNYYLGIRTGLQAASFYIDLVIGPEITPEMPGAPSLSIPADLATNVNEYTTFTWTAPTTGGVPTGYKLYCDTNSTPTTLIADLNALTYTLTTPLAFNTTYYWTVLAYNGAGNGPTATVRSFTTRADPTIYTFPWVEDFGTTTSFPPTNWSRLTGLYPSETPTSTTSGWTYDDFANVVTSPQNMSARLNIWSTTTKYWLVTPPIAIPGAGYELKFDLALTTYSGIATPPTPGNQPDDRFLVLISDNPMMTNPTVLREWNNSGSAYVYDNISPSGENHIISLNAYSGTKYIAFYGESTVSNGDNNVYVDNVTVRETPAAPIISCTPASWDFGQTLIRTTKTKNFTITNIGGGTLSIISIAIEGDYYTLLTNPAPIGLTAGQTAIFTVQYAPLAVGNHNGTVTITDNRGTTIVDLSAVCYDPTIYSLPWIEDFGTTGTTFPPEYWTRWSGLLTAEPVTLTSVTSYWIQDDFANIVTNPANKSAKINIFGTTYKYWFITPPIQIPDTGYQLEFDLALTDYNNPAPPDDPAGYSGVDDKFVVLIGDGNSWSLANAVKIWDNDPTTEGGIYKVYNSISYTGEHCIIPLNSYVGFKYIAFYGESTVSNADNDLFVDNVMIRQTPSGAPDHVTLVSPANGATGLDPENIVLTWSPALTGGTPAYYQVMIGEYPIDPETGYFGDYQFDTENTNMNISAMLLDNLGFVLPYNTTWYWAVVPFNAGGEIPDLEAHEFMIWHFTTNVDPTITALSYAEYFDEVTAPTLPWGWKAYVSSTSTSAYVRTYYGTTYAQSTPNSVCLFNSTDTSADLRLITPPINVPGVSLNQIKLKFYAYGGSGYTLLIGTVNTTDASGVFTQVASINPTATKTEYTVSFENYTGTDHYICFKHGLGGTSRYIYIDNVKIIKLQPADLAATALSGPALIQTGTSYNYTISVYNEGTAEQSSYTVNLKSGTQPLVSLNVNSPLAVGATTQHTLIWTPQTAGIYPVYGEVVIAGDDNINNNATITINVIVADATVTVLSVGNDATTTSGYYLPLSMYYKNSVTEELYFNDEMHLQTGIITAIAYKNNFTDNIANKPVKIWMKCTTEQSLTTAWLSSQNYTLVFDGTINFPAGINYVVIPLDTPFNFTGGVLATRVNRPMDVTYYPSSNVFYYTNTSTEHPNRSLYLYSDSVVYDPLAPSAVGTLVSNVPNTFFVVQNATTDPQAILQGYVRNFVTNQPIVGATVTLTERLSTTTDANGFYKFSFWTNKTVDLTVQKDTYYSQTITNIALTVGTTVTQNFNLVPLPRVTVSGIVTANDYPTGLVGATVKISGTENYETTTGTGGAFSIGNVLGSADTLSYALTVEKEGYQTYISALNVATTNVNVGTINLTEYLWTPYNLVATHSGNNVSLTWEPAGVPNYYFCDFESDNGGWVSSGYGDWQWGHYNLANYMDIDTYTDTPPQSAHSGTKMWGTVLNGGYSNSGAWSYLRQTFDLSTFTNPVLSIWHYMNGYNTWDYGLIKVNGNTVWGNSSSAVFMPWQQLTIDLSAYSTLTNAEISFEWYATTTVSYAGWYIDDIYIGPASRNIVTTQFASRSSQDRWFLNYSVYRFLTADEGTPANWNLLQTGVSDTTYMDTTFGTLPGGKYKWAVIANYSGGLQSNAIISNMLGKVSAPQNVVANRVANTVQLSWTADPGADYYIIYAADDPYGTFTVFGYSNTNSYNIVNPPAKKFFKIASADGTMPVAKEIEPPTKRK